jgi:HTH-type transcriptional regulator/antitoxin HigA
MDEQDRENEKDADQFAIDTLISADEYAGFLASGDFSNDAIRNFSASIGIHAGIVSGRLAKEGHVDYKEINHLRNSFSL